MIAIVELFFGRREELRKERRTRTFKESIYLIFGEALSPPAYLNHDMVSRPWHDLPTRHINQDHSVFLGYWQIFDPLFTSASRLNH